MEELKKEGALTGEDFINSLDDIKEKKGTHLLEEIQIDKGRMYLKNVGQPSVLTIDKQKKIGWLDERCRKITIEIIKRGDEENEKFGLELTNMNKALIYYNNGNYSNTVKVPINKTFQVYDYPHIVDFPVGTNKLDEKKYTLKVGEVVRIDNNEDAEVVLKNFDYVAETNEGGKLIKPNRFLEQLKNGPAKVDTSGFKLESLESVPLDRVKRQTEDAKPISLESMDKQNFEQD